MSHLKFNLLLSVPCEKLQETTFDSKHKVGSEMAGKQKAGDEIPPSHFILAFCSLWLFARNRKQWFKWFWTTETKWLNSCFCEEQKAVVQCIQAAQVESPCSDVTKLELLSWIPWNWGDIYWTGYIGSQQCWCHLAKKLVFNPPPKKCSPIEIMKQKNVLVLILVVAVAAAEKSHNGLWRSTNPKY